MEIQAIQTLYPHIYVSPEELRMMASVLEDEIKRRESTIAGKIIASETHRFGNTLRDGLYTLSFHPPK
jgi:hypothetical protein